MARQTLSDRTLKNLKPAPAGGRYELFDAIIPMMGVRVTDKGKRSFFLLARFPPSINPTRRALGEYPVLELAAARDKARQWLGLLERGIDPKRQIEEEREANRRAEQQKQDRSFETIIARYIKARRRDGVRKVDEDRQDFERECLPLWKGKDVAAITMADVLKVVEGIRDRGKTRQALNMAQKIGTFLKWCAADELISVSPFKAERVKIAIGRKQSRERVLTDDEIRAFWKASESLDAIHRDVYRVLLLSGQRLNDIAQASWSEIDFDKKTLTIPAARFKSQRDHVVPLTDDVIEILQNVRRWRNCPWVFSLDGNKPVSMADTVKRRIDKELRGMAPWVNHDLRRTVRTRLSELDVLDEAAEAVIGHMPTALVRTYNQSDRLRIKLDALNRWQGELRNIVGAETPNNVVPIPVRA